MATLRTGMGSVLDVVTQTSNTLVQTVGTFGDAVGMLNDFVQRQREKQQENYVADRVTSRDVAIENFNLEAVKREEKIRNYIGNDPVKQESYNKNDAKLRAAFEAYDKKNAE